MKILDELKESFVPAANNLNKTIMSAAVIVNHKLDLIHRASSDLLRPDVGDYLFRLNFKKKVAEGETIELGECPTNEMWAIQAVVVDGITEKSPAFIVTIDQFSLIFSVIKEGVGTETIGGDISLRNGESLFLTARTAGTISMTIHILRRMIPSIRHQDFTGEPGALLEPINTHEQGRDLVAAPTGQWVENPSETLEVGT